MASTVGIGVFNALAFAGAGYLFKMLDKNNYEKEIKRHNLAIEKFQKDKEKWYEQNVERRQKIQQLEREVEKANNNIETTNEALHQLRKAKDIQAKYEAQEPKLEHYYKPGKEMESYMHIFLGLFGSSLGAVIWKFVF